MKKNLPPGALFLEFSRKDADTRIVEGYAFVNEKIEGERVTWARTAIEAATPEYLKWGNVREMHQPSAVGVVTEATWDDKGLFVRAEIVDDACWTKIEKGVYKGFSMRIRPLSMRGYTVTKTKISEISVVDQPKEGTDCVFAVARGEGVEDCEVEFEEEEIQRGAFATQVIAREKSTLRYMAMEVLGSVLWDIQNGSDTDKEALARAACAEFTDYIAPIVSRAELADPSGLSAALDVADLYFASLESKRTELENVPIDSLVILSRSEVEAYDQSVSTLTQERDLVRAELGEAQTAKAAAEARVSEMEKMPVKTPPMKYVGELNRTFAANHEATGETRETLEQELARIQAEAPTKSESERMQMATRVTKIKQELARLSQ